MVYNSTSFLNGNDYLPPTGCVPPTSGASSGGGTGVRRELATGLTETYTIQINDADPTAVQQLFTSVESGSLTGSSSIASVWATLQGVSASGVVHAPFQGGVDALGNKFSPITAGGILVADKTTPIVAGTDGTLATTTTAVDTASTSSSPACGSGCIAGAVVGSVVGAVLIVYLIVASIASNKAKAAAAATATSSDSIPYKGPAVTVRAATVKI